MFNQLNLNIIVPYLSLYLTGFLGGILGGMLGIGGGVIVVPTLFMFLHIPLKKAIALSLGNIVFVSLGASFNFLRAKLVNVKLALLLELASVPGALLGVACNLMIPQRLLRYIFAAILSFTAYKLLSQIYLKSHSPTLTESTHDTRHSLKELLLAMLGAMVAGWASGLLGIGGGTIKMPILILLLNLPIKQAIGTSSLMVGITALSGSLSYIREGLLTLGGMIAIGMGGLSGSLLGSRLSQRFNPNILKLMLAILISVVALKFII